MAEFPRSVGLIGCGAWGQNIARVLAELGVLATIFDSNSERAKTIAGELKVAYEPSVASLLKRSDIQAVAIATPAISHAETGLAAIAAGKDVFIEKPLALSTIDARRLDEVSRSNRRILMVGHLLQYHPSFNRLRELVRTGALGRIRYMYSNRLNQGRIRTEENVVWSLAPHDFSMLLALAGELPSAVTAIHQTVVQPNIADLATVHLDFPSGLRAHVFCSWLSPYRERTLAVIGDVAMAVFDESVPDWGAKLIVYHNTVSKGEIPVFVKGETEKIPVSEREPLREEMLHFLECVHNRQVPRTGADEAIPVLEVLVAAQKSMETGNSVRIK